MLLCLSVLSICAHAVYWKGHRLWLLSHREPTCQPADMTLFECERVHVIRAASEHRWWQSDWGCQGGLQTFPSVSPDRKLGAAEALPCLICQQPARLMVRTTPRAGRLFWFQPVWHICCLSRRVESLAWPGEDARLIHPLSFYTHGSSLQTMSYERWGGRDLRDPTITCASGFEVASWYMDLLLQKRFYSCSEKRKTFQRFHRS